MDIFDELMLRAWGYPRMGEVRRYKVVNEEEYDIVPKRGLLERQAKELEDKIAQRKRIAAEYDKQTAELESELQKQKKRLSP